MSFHVTPERCADFIAGGYDGPQTQVTLPTELNVAYYALPEGTPTNPTSDGWIARIAADVSQTAYEVSDLVIVHEPRADAIVACESSGYPWGFAYMTFDFPTPNGFSFWVVPEPATCAGLLMLFGFAAFRRRETN